jgi:hypothetical protein
MFILLNVFENYVQLFLDELIIYRPRYCEKKGFQNSNWVKQIFAEEKTICSE